MGGKITEKIITVLPVLFLLIYAGFQLAKFFVSPVKTETVYEYTISQSVGARGAVFREEIVLEDDVYGVQSCLYDDGERVLAGNPVAEYASPSSEGSSRGRLRDAEWEISMLKEAQSTTLNHLSNADALGRDINQQLGYLVRMSAAGEYRRVQEVRPALVSLLNKRQIATGKETSFQSRIDALETELSALRSVSSAAAQAVIKAPVTGYYAKPVDGLESAYTINAALESGYEELLELIDVEPFAGSAQFAQKAGRIVTSQNWYIAVEADKDDAEWILPGQRLDLEFNAIAGHIPATVIRALKKDENGKAVIVLHCNHVSADTINLRTANVQLNLQQFSGLKVDTSWLRFQEGERGVYVLEKNTVRFKRIDTVYEEPEFILSRQPNDPYDSETLRQFDQIITKGIDLADGKIID